MLATATARIDELISDSLRQTDEANLREEYCEQDEFVVVEDFLSPEVLSRWEVELEKLKPHIHRNYLPGHKEGRQHRLQNLNALAPSISNMKDAVAYFGLRGLFGKGRVR